MKQRNSAKKPKLVLTPEELNRLVTFFQVLIEIDKKLNLSKRYSQKASPTNKSKITSISHDSRYRESFLFCNNVFAKDSAAFSYLSLTVGMLACVA